MIPIDDWTAQILRASHTSTTTVRLITADGDDAGPLPIGSGTLTLDADDQGYASLVVELADPSVLATGPVSPLTPFGARLRVEVAISAGRWWSQTLRVGPDMLITSVPTLAGHMSSREVTAGTLVQMVRDDRFLAPWQPPASSTVHAALTGLLTGSVPGAPVQVGAPDAPVTGAPVWERERWDAVVDLAAQIGCVPRPAADGFAVAPPPAATDPVWTVDAGAGGVLLPGQARPEVTRDRWNAVVASNPDDPEVRAVATLDDPSSPVRWDGPYGRRPYFFTSPLLTPATAATAAATRLASLQGSSRRIEARIVPCPALEPGDTVAVVWPGGMRETCRVVSVEIPLAGGPMRLGLLGALS